MNQTYLLIDDDEVFTSILSRALQRRSIRTVVANNSESAIKLLSNPANSISHAVLDLNMGRDSGLTLLPQLIEVNNALLVVVLTGYSSIATTVEAMKRGTEMVVRGISSRGTRTTDTYSLSGVTAAMNEIDKACK